MHEAAVDDDAGDGDDVDDADAGDYHHIKRNVAGRTWGPAAFLILTMGPPLPGQKHDFLSQT